LDINAFVILGRKPFPRADKRVLMLRQGIDDPERRAVWAAVTAP